MNRVTAACLAAFLVLALLRVWLTLRGRREQKLGLTADGTAVIVRRAGALRELVLARGHTELVQARSDGSGYQREFHRAMRTTPRPRRILVLGGGAGVVAMSFARRYGDVVIDVVEKEPLVVEAAKAHFGFEESARLKLHVADARDLLARAPTREYDLVLFDIYDAHGIPPALSTPEVFASIRAVLAPSGTLVANLVRPPSPTVLAALAAAFPDSPVDVQDVTDENSLVFVSRQGS